MSTLPHPSVLIDLGNAGETGIPMSADSKFQHEVEMCLNWGFKIQAVDNCMRLLFDNDQLVPRWIQNETPLIAWDRIHVKGFLRLPSTNTEAHDMAGRGAPNGTLLYAEEQTAGRGRNNRAWHSPAGTGLYCTVILRPKQPRRYWPLLTHAASLALADTLKGLFEAGVVPFPLDVDIKWPNDVLLAGKKCAGILLEALGDDKDSAALIGFGINVRKGSVPESLAEEATCLDEIARIAIPRRLLLVHYLQHLQHCCLLFEQGQHQELLDRWKSNSSMWNGEKIYIGKNNMRRESVTCGLNSLGALIVRNPDGSLETLLAEDVRISRRES